MYAPRPHCQLEDNEAFLAEQRSRIRAAAKQYLDAIAANGVRAIALQEELGP